MASASDDGTIRVWDLATGQCSIVLRVSKRQEGLVAALRLTIILMDQSHPININMQGHEGAVTSVVFTSDNRQLISGGKDGTVRLWDLASGQLIMTLQVRRQISELPTCDHVTIIDT